MCPGVGFPDSAGTIVSTGTPSRAGGDVALVDVAVVVVVVVVVSATVTFCTVTAGLVVAGPGPALFAATTVHVS